MRAWLLLTYKIPPRPTASRVYVWRKLRRLGAELLQDAVWALPASPRTEEQLQRLAAEIREMRGQALLWRGQLTDADQHRSMVQRFEAPVEQGYRDLLSGLQKKSANRAALAKRYRQLRARDYFQCELGQEVRAALTIGKGDSS